MSAWIFAPAFLPTRCIRAARPLEAFPDTLPTPQEIKSHMDRVSIIGQDAAKVALSVAVYNHYKRIYFENDTDTSFKRATSC